MGKGETVIVTGAARGIGRAIALLLAKEEYRIAAVDIDIEAWKQYGADSIYSTTTAVEIQEAGGVAIDIEADLSIKKNAETMVRKVIKTYGRVDILINAAGGLSGSPERSYSSLVPEEELKATFNNNLFNTIFCCQSVIPIMKKASEGIIINFGSQAGLRAADGGFYASYGIAKAAVIMYTRYLAQELGSFGIRVNCISPAYVASERANYMVYNDPLKKAKTEREIALGRIAQPIDIAKSIRMLISDDGKYITGQNINVCGGVIRF